MSTANPVEVIWAPPGPGLWERDAAHQERPFSALWLEMASGAFAAGTSDAFARFGIPFARFETANLHGWFFGTLTPVADEEFPDRIAAAELALTTRPWRAIADEWSSSARAVFVARNRAIQAVDPAGLSDEALAAHLAGALGLLRDAATRHFLDAVAHWVSVGLLLMEAGRLAGWPPERTIRALAGASPASVAPAAAVGRIRDAIAADPEAARISSSGGDPEAALAALRGSSQPVRDAIDAYLDEHGWQVFTGFDFTHQTMAELPGLFLATIRAGAMPPPRDLGLLAELRAAAGPDDRAALETIIDDAILGYGLRDDDSGPTTQQPIGLVRRGLLEAGRRLAARGEIAEVDDIFDASGGELAALLTGQGGRPTQAELAARGSLRRTPAPAPPRRLGEDAPPPDGELPPAMERIMGALFAAMSLEDTADEVSPPSRELRGVGASAGVYEGRARLIRGEGDFERLEPGDILVASMTTPAYNVVLPLLGAVVTDRGGILSHPAIVAREYGIPAVVGAGDATAQIADGARIRVDGLAGLVTLLS